jgi:hypothetical protein
MNNCRGILIVAGMLFMALAGTAWAEGIEPAPAPKGAYVAAYHKHRPPVRGRLVAPVPPRPACTLLDCLTLVGVAP